MLACLPACLRIEPPLVDSMERVSKGRQGVLAEGRRHDRGGHPRGLRRPLQRELPKCNLPCTEVPGTGLQFFFRVVDAVL